MVIISYYLYSLLNESKGEWRKCAAARERTVISTIWHSCSSSVGLVWSPFVTFIRNIMQMEIIHWPTELWMGKSERRNRYIAFVSLFIQPACNFAASVMFFAFPFYRTFASYDSVTAHTVSFFIPTFFIILLMLRILVNSKHFTSFTFTGASVGWQ